ncbi:MAG: YaaA family protein [Erysipelothrix sp.]|nr:YaaA family protein [Erysipelothrix sp.]
MKIILSPTKTMTNKAFDIQVSDPIFSKQADKIRKILKTYSKDDLKKLYKASDKIIDRTYDYYQDAEASCATINAYDGLVFKQLAITNYSEEHFAYLNDKLIILSTMYGLLRPSDAIVPYRLDYLMPFEKDMYTYWNEHLTDHFKDEEYIINLASNEYAKSFEHNNIINIHFINEAGKSLATAAKMARGQFVNHMVLNNIQNLNELKAIEILDYKYNPTLSDENNLYFQIEVSD